MDYEAVIGLEVHVHLKTKTKAFCGCSTQFGNEPNSQVCPVCLGFPGALPVLNRRALAYAVKVALVLNCKVQPYTKFDRKNYFYPDLPKNYQISQYDLPLSRDGFLDIESEGQAKRIGIHRVHMEEDAGKLIHKEDCSLVDFNRAGIPLLEIVSDPHMNSAQEAYEYLVTLKSIIEYLDVSDCDMEKGSLRCDANVSIRQKGASALGTKTELKNMNSFKAVRDALAFEIERQEGLLDAGEKIAQQTLLWDAGALRTLPMRTKEEAQDYRYFPEPDLTAFVMDDKFIKEAGGDIPELPREKARRLAQNYGLSKTDAQILAVSKNDAEYAEACIKLFRDKEKKPMVNWLIGPLFSEANNRNCRMFELGVLAQDFVELVEAVERQEISSLSAKAVLSEMVVSKKPPALIIKEKNLMQISDSRELEAVAKAVVEENPKSVNDYRAGKGNALMFLVGQAMKKSRGKANPKIVQDILKSYLDKIS